MGRIRPAEGTYGGPYVRFGPQSATSYGSRFFGVRTARPAFTRRQNRQHREGPSNRPCAYVPGQNRQHRTRGSSRCVRRTVSVRGKNRPRRTDRGSWGSVRPTARKVWPQIGRIVRIAPLGGPYSRPRVRLGPKSAASYGSRLLGVRTAGRAYVSAPNRPRRTDRASWGPVRPARTFRHQIGRVIRIASLGGPYGRPRVRLSSVRPARRLLTKKCHARDSNPQSPA